MMTRCRCSLDEQTRRRPSLVVADRGFRRGAVLTRLLSYFIPRQWRIQGWNNPAMAHRPFCQRDLALPPPLPAGKASAPKEPNLLSPDVFSRVKIVKKCVGGRDYAPDSAESLQRSSDPLAGLRE